MIRQAWLGAAVAISFIGGCTKADFDSNDRPTSYAKVGEARPVTVAPPGVLESRVLDLADCALEGTQVTSMCPAMQRLSRDVSQSKAMLAPDAAKRLLQHHAPAVRVEAGALSADRTLVVDAAHRERDPQVRQALVKLLAGDPHVAAFATDSSAAVRREVVTALATRATPAGVVALAHIVETDSDETVRADACRLAGNLADDALLPMFERTTGARAPELRDACMEGLSAMVFESEGAYRLFLRRISEGVRPWQAMSAFCPYKAATRPAWFSVDEVRAVLTAVVEDKATSPMAVAAARESLDTLSR
jgi:hypothetical protein